MEMFAVKLLLPVAFISAGAGNLPRSPVNALVCAWSRVLVRWSVFRGLLLQSNTHPAHLLPYPTQPG